MRLEAVACRLVEKWLSDAPYVREAKQCLRCNIRSVRPADSPQLNVERQLGERGVVLGDLGEDRTPQQRPDVNAPRGPAGETQLDRTRGPSAGAAQLRRLGDLRTVVRSLMTRPRAQDRVARPADGELTAGLCRNAA
jgi:hypothetical protein